MVLFLGSTPIGGPIVGWIGQHAGARWSFVVGGVAGLVGAAMAGVPFLRRRLAASVSEQTVVRASAA
jgi:MFS family permease